MNKEYINMQKSKSKSYQTASTIIIIISRSFKTWIKRDIENHIWLGSKFFREGERNA